MFGRSASDPPSPLYVFVTISLAAFLALFLFCKYPQSHYNAYATASIELINEGVPVAQSTHVFDVQGATNDLRTVLLSPENVLSALNNTGMLTTDEAVVSAETMAIAEEISSRMRLSCFSENGQPMTRLVLLTEHPMVGRQLLDQIMTDSSLATDSLGIRLQSNEALAQRVLGTAIAPGNLLLLLLCSVLVGVGGLVLLEQSHDTPVLLTRDDVQETAHLPVIADFAENKAIPLRGKQLKRRRRLQVAVMAAEAVVAAAIVLVVANAVMSQPFASLLVNDPLAAYSDALTQVLG